MPPLDRRAGASGYRRPTRRHGRPAEFHVYQVPRADRRGLWLAVAVSVLLHLLVLVPVAIRRADRVLERVEQQADADAPAPEPRAVEMVYLPPPPPPPEVRREPAPAPRDFTPIGPEDGAKAPPVEPPPDEPPSEEEAPERRAESTEPATTPPQAQPPQGPTIPNPFAPPTAARTPQRSQPEAPATGGDAWARPGSQTLGPRLGIGPRDNRRWKASFPDLAGQCLPEPPDPADTTSRQGIVEGRVLREDNGLPLTGAHLQILGTGFTAFTDNRGEYRMVFDRSLLDQCRTQYVRVSAPGYKSRLLVLGVGRYARSDDVVLPRY